MRHVSRTHRVLDWLFDRINLDPEIRIKYIDTKNQLADILTKGNFTRDAWNHLLCLFNISHFSSTDCSEVMSKRTRKDSGEERVTAKSKPMMNLVSRCSARTPDVLSSTASESPVKTRHESQFPLSSRTEQHHRTGRPVEDAYSSSNSEWNVDKTLSSQEWKSDELMEDRTGRPVVFAQHTDRFIIENDNMDSCTEAGSEMSLESRSFLHWVNDHVRKSAVPILKRCNKRQRQTLCDIGNVYFFYITSIYTHGKELVRQLHSIKNTEDLTLKQMCPWSWTARGRKGVRPWLRLKSQSGEHVRSPKNTSACEEMRGAILWVSQQVDTTTLQSIYSMHWWPQFKEEELKPLGEIVKCMLSNSSEMLFLGTYWTTWYSMVGHMWIQTVVWCG